MRPLLTLLHRWFGLFIAVFLFIAGLTGALISWDHELDAWLNPGFYHHQSEGEARSPLDLANELEAANPNILVTFLPLSVRPGEALTLSVEPRSAEAFESMDFNQLAVNPVSGEIQAERMWGAISLAKENILPFLYKLHYTMHIPDMNGIELGMWFMGIVSTVWILDCFIALIISFPRLRSWRKSFAFRWRSGGYKLNFDLHRSGGVWVWGLLLMIAITSVSMNLGFEVVRPVVNSISPLTPSPFETRPLQSYTLPDMSREEVVAKAAQMAPEHGIEEAVGGIFYSPFVDVYGVGFFEPGNSHGDGGLGNAWLYFDGDTGEFISGDIPGQGSAGDIFMQLQFPLHSGRILGVYGRALMSVLGLIIAGLSVTGVIIWARKRAARLKKREIETGMEVSEGKSRSGWQPGFSMRREDV